jgi:antitoxin component of MazEF toxin-antitoxin module
MATQQLRAVGGSLMAIIPADIVREAGLKKGQLVDVSYSQGAIVIARKPDWASFLALDFPPEADTFLKERKQPRRRELFK